MTNMKLYSSKVNRLKKTFFFGSVPLGKVGANRNGYGIPVIVVDLQTNKSVKYTSINQAARSLAAHPKTIWRKVQNKQPYLERYLIVENYGKFYFFYINIIEYFNVKLKFLFNNYVILFYMLLNFVLFGYIIYKYNLYNIDNINVKPLKFALEEKFINNNNNIFNCIKTPVSDKVNGLVEFNKEWRSIYVLKNKTSFINNFPSKPELGVYQSIINEINLDFYTKTNAFSTLNSTHSSPLIERVNINSIFSNAIASTRPSINIVDSINTSNSLVINTQSIHSNRNYSILDNTLIWPRSPGRELLNYNSNVLYCLINGLSPSTY